MPAETSTAVQNEPAPQAAPEPVKDGNNQPPSTQQDEAGKPITPALFNESDEAEGGSTPQPAASDTQGEAEQGEEVKPLTKEDIAVPEGFSYDEELGKSFLDIVNDGKLSRKELAEKLVSMYSAQQGKMLAAMQAADTERAKQFEAGMKREKEDWMKQCQADEEYGGQKWDAAQAVIDRGCKRVATQAAVELMQRYNLNTHPEIVRMFYRAGKLAGEDRGGGNGENGGKKISPAEAIFRDSLKEYHARKGD